MKHTVKTFNYSGKLIYEANFATAEKAHYEFMDIVNNAEKTLPTGYGVHIVRYNDGREMAVETVIGTH